MASRWSPKPKLGDRVLSLLPNMNVTRLTNLSNTVPKLDQSSRCNCGELWQRGLSQFSQRVISSPLAVVINVATSMSQNHVVSMVPVPAVGHQSNVFLALVIIHAVVARRPERYQMVYVNRFKAKFMLTEEAYVSIAPFEFFPQQVRIVIPTVIVRFTGKLTVRFLPEPVGNDSVHFDALNVLPDVAH